MDRRNFLRSAVAAGVATAFAQPKVAAARMQALREVVDDIAAVSLDRKEVVLQRAEVQELSDSLRGNCLLPGNDGYDVARRVQNPGIDRHPALIVQPTGATDIRHAVTFARERELLLAVKCGGHSYSGKSTCEGGMQIDLSTHRHARIDVVNRRAHVAGGSLLGELDRESMAMGLVTTAGTVSHTGVGGLALGGGFGRVGRRFGLTLDNIRSVDIVTADGQLRHASQDENADLFWAVRGGGGNFGVVTQFEFELHPMQRTVVGGEILFPLAMTREVFDVYRSFALQGPNELYCDFMMTSPMQGADGLVGVHICWSGAESEAEKMLAPFLKLGTPIVNSVRALDYVDIQRSWDNTDPRNDAEYLKSGFVNDIPDALVDSIIDGFAGQDGRSVMIFFQHSGGAIGEVAMDATAFAQRKAKANMLLSVGWPMSNSAESHVDYIRSYWKSLERFTDGYYSVDSADESDEVRHGNYQINYDRLRTIKTKYDPGNLFRLNANIEV